MPISGRIYVVPNPDEQTWRIVIANEGDAPFTVTQNVLPPDNPNLKVHDDHLLNGHGLKVNAGKVSYQSFHAGDSYNHQGSSSGTIITEDCHLRLGIRNLAAHTIKLPDLNGPPVELDLADFNWYGGDAATAVSAHRDWPGSREHKANAADGPALLLRVRELLLHAQTNGVTCEGKATVTAMKDDSGRMSHWEVRFDNSGDQAWIGTMTFKNGDKNDGLGLESMGLPNNGSAAMQRIEYLGNYGVDAVAGETVRLGVRGYAWTEVNLPTDGAIEIPLEKFRIDTRKMEEAYFDRDAVDQKRNEKRDRVQFFDGDTAINDSLKPKTHHGDEARALADFDPPNLVVRHVEDGADTPGGGWIVSLESMLPDFDDKGRVGFVAAILAEGADPRSDEARKLGTKKLQFRGHEKQWFIARGADIGGVPAAEGTGIEIATRGIGWNARVALPKTGEQVDSTKDDQIWGLREDQIARRCLETKFINRFRD